MLSHYEDGKVHHRAVNACLCPLYAVEGMHVVTVEGIGNVRDGLHPVQAALANSHGSQCGFCTPGFVMSMYALLRDTAAKGEEAPSEEDIEECLAGNLCRCTGYRPILDAFKTFAKSSPAAYTEDAIAAAKGLKGVATTNGTAATAAGGAGGGNVCPSTGLPCDCNTTCSNGTTATAESTTDGGCGAADCCKKTNGVSAAAVVRVATCEPIFPGEFKSRKALALHLPGGLSSWWRPTGLGQLLALKAAAPELRMVGGNSEVGIEMKFKHAGYKHLVAVTHVPELNEVVVKECGGLEVGAAVTLSRLEEVLRAQMSSRPPSQTSGFKAVVEQLRWFAGRQIWNVGTLGGNICTASPISDLNPLWMAMGASFVVVAQGGKERQIPASEFFLGYRQVDLKPDEILLKVIIPPTSQFEYVKEFKQAPRRDDDIAIVNAGMRVRLAPAAAAAWRSCRASP